MIVCGIDPSLTATGLAVIIDGTVTTGTINSKGKKADTWEQRRERLTLLSNRIVNSVPVDALVMIEAPAYSSNVGSIWDRAGLWWSIYFALHKRDHAIIPVSPGQRAKYGSGKGNAGKDEVLAAVVRRYLDVDVPNNNVADALVLAAMGARLLGHPIEESLPKAHLDAMELIALPEGH